MYKICNDKLDQSIEIINKDLDICKFRDTNYNF